MAQRYRRGQERRRVGLRSVPEPPKPRIRPTGLASMASPDNRHLIFESDAELVCRYLPDTTLTYVNEAYCQFFGSTRQELLGRAFLDLIPEPARAAAREHVASLLETPRVVADEHKVVLADGSVAWQHWIDLACV